MSKKFKAIEPNQHDVTELRRKLNQIVKRMQRDFETYLKPIIKKLQAQKLQEKKELQDRIKEFNSLVTDAVRFLTAWEIARNFRTIKQKIVSEIEKGEFEGAIQQNGEWLVPEESVDAYARKHNLYNKDLLAEFNRRIEELTFKYNSLLKTYKSMSEDFVERMYKESKKKFMKQFKKSFGIDAFEVLSERGLKEEFLKQVDANVSLIKTIPETYFSQISKLVVNTFSGKREVEGGLVNALQELTGVTRNRAKLIARDQSMKCVSSFNELRFRNLGSERYIWHNSRDRRVAGNPNGKYPDVDPKSEYHGNHWEREGKIFYWNKPPADGHPGMAINCRCYAEPIFEEEE